MCNRYGLTHPITEINQLFGETVRPLSFPAGTPNLEPREDIHPTNPAAIVRPVGEGLEWAQARWGLIPFFHRKSVKEWRATTFNCRGETAATSAAFKGAFARRRCLVPASHFFEWTGPKGSKTKWKIARPDGGWFAFAGIWDRAETADGTVESFTLLTTAPGPDIEPLHDRQPVIVDPQDWAAWLDPANPADRIIRAAPAGTLVYGPAAATAA